MRIMSTADRSFIQAQSVHSSNLEGEKMKYIFVNLKRFDIPKDFGGVNSLAPIANYGSEIILETQDKIEKYDNAEFAVFFQEAHILSAKSARKDNSKIKLGCQSVFREDTAIGGNFGAFTTNRTANAAKALGCDWTIIGHCEERRDKAGVLAEAGVVDNEAVNRLLNKEVKAALAGGLKVLYCIGETSEEQTNWQEVLKKQLEIGLADVDTSNIVIAYEPVWAIGPGKIPPDRDYIVMIAEFIKKVTNNLPVVYGGGLKEDNAEMLASINEIDGGLIALTRFKGDIGFYPEEYAAIVERYLGDKQ
jgi:triosephosphate isomerase (TIM)